MTKSANEGRSTKTSALTNRVRGAVDSIGPNFLQLLIQPSLERRKAAWTDLLCESLASLKDTGVDTQLLQDDERFVSTVLQATQIAIRTHQKEKIAALKNAVVNVAVGRSPDEIEQHMFLELVDTLSEMHIRILRLFSRPTPPPGMSMGGLSSVLEHNIPSLRGRRDLYLQLWKDLYQRGLVNTDSMNTTMSGSGLAERRTSALGEGLLAFISDPST